MSAYPQDIYTEPANQDGDTLKNLGPLAGMAGIWTGERGLDVKPGLTKLYHDQVGYWLWEPATGVVIQSMAIPRGQTEPFHHIDRNTLTKIGEPTPNPLAPK